MDIKECELALTFYPTPIAAQILHISTRQLRRDARMISSRLRGDFGWKAYNRGFTPDQMAILTRYRELRILGMSAADSANHIRINGIKE